MNSVRRENSRSRDATQTGTMWWAANILFVTFSLFSLSSSNAQSIFAPGVQFTEEVILPDLPASTAVAFTPDNSRIFLALKNGLVRLARTDNNTLISTPFLDISSMVNSNTDRGLLAIAVDPKFPTRPYVYLSFVFNPAGTATNSRDPKVSRLVRVTADAAFNYDRAVAGSMVTLIGSASVAENIAAPLDPAAPSSTPQPASCMTGLIMGGDVLPSLSSGDPEPRTENAPIEDCIPADGLSHTAGMLLFDKEGTTLFASFGDGSSYDGANRPAIRALLKDTLNGKILRVDPDTGDGVPGNPFYEPSAPRANRSRVWSYGLRNPFRFTLHPSTGQVFLADVGSSRWEEINAGKGSNFGWPCFEGGVAAGAGTESGDTQNLPSTSYNNFARTRTFCGRLYELQRLGLGNLTRAVFSYGHPLDEAGNDLGAAVTGVAFYNGTSYPQQYRGALFFSDFARRFIRYLTFDPATQFPTAHDFALEVAGSESGVVQLLENSVDKNIYALYLNTRTKKSALRRFKFAGTNSPPRVQIAANPASGRVPLTVNFRSDGTSDPDGHELSYRWDFGDGNGSDEKHPIHTYEGVGSFTARLIVTETNTSPPLSSTGTVTVRTGSTPPRAFIALPVAGSRYKIGDSIEFAGGADYEPGAGEPPVTLSWSILQHHNLHTHLVQEFTGESGSFDATEHADNSFYEVCLFAEAGEGLRDQTCVEVRPITTEYTFASSPPGAPISYVDEGSTVLAPHIAKPILNSVQTIVANNLFGGRHFVRWSDGVTTQDRTFTVGTTPTTFQAIYENLAPILQIAAAPTVGSSPLTVRFDAGASRDPDGEPLTFTWLFPDGSTAIGPIVEKTFTADGSFVVTLTGEDRTGATSTRSQVIIVGTTPPSPSPETSPVSQPEPTPVPLASPIPTVIPFVDVPAGKISTIRTGRNSCGNKTRPCSFALRQTFEIRGTFRQPKPNSTDGVILTALFERQVGQKWRGVSEKSATLIRTTGFRIRTSGAKLKKQGLYRVRFRIQRGSNPVPKLTAYQYFRIP